jgi:hypothetical protein
MDRRLAAARRLPDPPWKESMVSRPPCLTSLFCSAQGSIHRALPVQERVGSRKVGPAGRQRLAGLAAPVFALSALLFFPGHPSQFRTNITKRQRRQSRCPAMGIDLQE